MNSIESLVSPISTPSAHGEEGLLPRVPATQADAAALSALRALLSPSLQAASQIPAFDVRPVAAELPALGSEEGIHLDDAVLDQEVAALLQALEGSAPHPAVMEALRSYFSGSPAALNPSQMPVSEGAVKSLFPREVRLFLQTGEGAETIPANLLPLFTQVREALSSGVGQRPGQTTLAEDGQVKLQALIKPEVGRSTSHNEAPEIPSDLSSNPVFLSPEVRREIYPLLDNEGLGTFDENLSQESHSPLPINLGHAILQSLDSQSSVTSVPTSGLVDPTAHVHRLEQVSALMAEMADRVLVTDPLHGQPREVRIKLAEHMIPNTEVRVWHGEGGQLRIEFETTSGYWARVLNEATPQLAQRLNEKLTLPEAALVSVSQQGGQPGDGRSRNRQTPWDLAAANQEP